MSNTDQAYVANLEQGLRDVITASYGSPAIQSIAQKALSYQTPEVDQSTVSPDASVGEVEPTTDTTSLDAAAATTADPEAPPQS